MYRYNKIMKKNKNIPQKEAPAFSISYHPKLLKKIPLEKPNQREEWNL